MENKLDIISVFYVPETGNEQNISWVIRYAFYCTDCLKLFEQGRNPVKKCPVAGFSMKFHRKIRKRIRILNVA